MRRESARKKREGECKRKGLKSRGKRRTGTGRTKMTMC